jgi:hypothetical protein
MRQNEFILKVTPVTRMDSPVKDDYVLEGFKIAIDAWDIGGQFMIDQQITYFYPQLLKIDGIDELAEGAMAYSGNLTYEELVGTLEEWGFVIEGSKKHADLTQGKEIECKIEPRTEEDDTNEDEGLVFEMDKRIAKPKKTIKQLEMEMNRAAGRDDFETAIKIRDEINKRKEEENETP